jgi:hypothetical protein
MNLTTAQPVATAASEVACPPRASSQIEFSQTVEQACSDREIGHDEARCDKSRASALVEDKQRYIKRQVRDTRENQQLFAGQFHEPTIQHL